MNILLNLLKINANFISLTIPPFSKKSIISSNQNNPELYPLVNSNLLFKEDLCGKIGMFTHE
jgi:hypothetical protein